MTDTGQVPGEGLPESAGMVEQPGVPAPGAYTYLSPRPPPRTKTCCCCPGAQGAWGNEMRCRPPPEPVVEAVHEPGPHETGRPRQRLGRPRRRPHRRLGRRPQAARRSRPAARCTSARRPPTPPPSPVRSLADRGPAGAPAPVRQFGTAGPPAPGPEYLDAPPLLADPAPQSAAPWGAQAQAHARVQAAPAPLLGQRAAHPRKRLPHFSPRPRP